MAGALAGRHALKRNSAEAFDVRIMGFQGGAAVLGPHPDAFVADDSNDLFERDMRGGAVTARRHDSDSGTR